MTSSAGPGEPRLKITTDVKGSAVWIFIHGDADVATLDDLDAALSNIVLDGHKAVCIDVSGMQFIDVTSLRRLANFAMNVRRSGREVTTVGAPALLRTITGLLDDEDQLGLT